MKNQILGARICMLLLTVIGIVGCQFDMNVPNPNAPDRERASSSAEEVEDMIGGTFLDYWHGTHYAYPSLALSAMGDELSSGWSSFAISALSSEPRQAWNNSISYDRDRQNMNWYPWSLLYSALSMCRDGVKSVDDGLRIVDSQGHDNTARALAFARFVMGLSHAWIGCFFDQGFILDEDTNLETDLVLKPYGDLVDKGVEFLESCIAICETNAFELPDTWINGNSLNQDELKALAHSFIARFLVSEGRTAAERDAADWEAIKAHADQGVAEDFMVQGDGEFWWSGLLYYGEGTFLCVADNKCIGPADTSGNYQAWLATPVSLRDRIIIHTPDLRLYSGDPTGGIDHTGTDFDYIENCPFNPAKGKYHCSHYFHDRYIEHVQTLGNSPMPEFRTAELDLILAEYWLREGDAAQAAVYINKTRTARGGLEPVSAADGLGSVSDGRSIYGSLWSAFMYEKGIELYVGCPGGAFFDRRGWDQLVTNTVIHFPIPARELQTLGMDSYTFGGGGPGSAPKMRPGRVILY